MCLVRQREPPRAEVLRGVWGSRPRVCRLGSRRRWWGDRHLIVLRQALEHAIEDHACVLVTVLAPPGVGKSRLATTFSDAVRERATLLVRQTPSYGEGVTFAPLVELLSQAAGQPGGDSEEIATALRERLVEEPDA